MVDEKINDPKWLKYQSLVELNSLILVDYILVVAAMCFGYYLSRVWDIVCICGFNVDEKESEIKW